MDARRPEYHAARRWRARCIGTLLQRGWRRLLRRCRAALERHGGEPRSA
jgi:hypothetical protein